MNLDELFISDAFRAFQQEQVKAVAQFLHFKIMVPNGDSQEMAGALELARTILNLPGKLVKDKERYAQEISAMTATAFIDLRLDLIKEALRSTGGEPIHDADTEPVLDSNSKLVREPG